MVQTRLCLVTPEVIADGFDRLMDAALAAGDITSLLIAVKSDRSAASAAISIAMAHDVAAIALGDPDIAGIGGVQIETGTADLKAARIKLGNDRIVGAGGIRSRHDAMLLGECMPDYLFFGRIDDDSELAIHSTALELASWSCDLFEIPTMVMGGSDVSSVETARRAGIEFVALRNAVWNHPQGAAMAVAQANAILDRTSTA